MKTSKSMLLLLLIGLFLVPGLRAVDSKAMEGDWSMYVPDKNGGQTVFSIFTFHVDGDRLTGFMSGPNGRRRIVLEDGKIQGTQFSFEFDENKITGKLLSDTTMELVFPSRHEGPRTYKAAKTPGAFKALPEALKAIHGVDQSKMGPYRALANLAYDATKKGEMEKAAMFCQILERVWDHGERTLHNKAEETWLQIDKTMDNFIGPILGYQKKAPDLAKLQELYQAYLEKLKLAD